ncbi:DUF4190 domain-containing protein [Agromyces protaetiae]|uniref:DUF4190 domain-containing protein n=1 Tax=Agromyces protaetiae TaxID=2509455 RepID=A0A4P6FAG2_9MICO|nr:DUF4190 domain-containing protein [Agromyces protaetiae]QAY73200.1 DUF4190 domain-containing protein [Agromyces protaetiae]
MSEREGVPPISGTPDPFPRTEAPPLGETTRRPAAHDSDPDAPAIDPLAEYHPGGTTHQAIPPIREFDETFDTGVLHQLPTGQLLIVHRPGVPPSAGDAAEDVDVQRRVYSWVGAVLGSIGAVASLFVGWMLPLAVAAIVFGVLGLRREEHGRSLAFVAIGTGITGLVFSAVWIGYYLIVYGALPS